MDYFRHESEIDVNISVHIAPTKLNIHLPENYHEDLARNKPEWWVNRFLNGSFENKEGLVYPDASKHYVEPFAIPDHWERVVGGDFGISNPTAIAFGAIDPSTGVLYIFDEHYQTNKPVNYHAEKINKRLETFPYGRLRFIVGDPSGKNRRESDLRSTFDHYAEYGIYFQAGSNKVADGVAKMFTFFELGKLKIFNTCKNLINELEKYKYPERKEGKIHKDLPVAVDDHLVDAVRYIVVELPDDASQLITDHFPSNYGKIKQSELVHALQEDEDEYFGNTDWINYY